MPKDMQYPKKLTPVQMKCRAMQLQLSLNTDTHTHTLINYGLNNRQFQLPQLPELYWTKNNQIAAAIIICKICFLFSQN